MFLLMVCFFSAPNKESGKNPEQFADYCDKLRFVPAGHSVLLAAIGGSS